jgi:hypothetical protein
MATMNVRWIAFVLLVIGTVGLVLNEFVLDWGRSVTLLFAAFNLVGLLGMATGLRGERTAK